MSKGLLAGKIGSLRKSKGLSQEELADSSSINLRTLQRIESGKTEPRGKTLRLIAEALDTPIEDFQDFTQEQDTGYLKAMNLAALSLWLLPLGNIFIPLILWIMKRNKIKGVNELGRRIINFQITWTIVTYGIAYGSMRHIFNELPFSSSPFGILPIILGLYLLNSVVILVAAYRIGQGYEKVYPNSLPIVR